MEILKKLSKEELLLVALNYSDYVMTFYDDHEEDMYPVCIEEYYLNEYQELIK